MDDKLAAQIGHWIWAIFITGGGSGAVISYWLFTRKKPKPPHEGCAKNLDEHKIEDNKRFDDIKNHLEKQYDLLVNLSGDTGKIKGKLGIQ